ncbi:XrtA/PEP-CTERM system exopolysaccharide export protein [Siccirubricoccus phaeus]|uniref:XrtA/PEP-CTERM system exopolysaccharide export protein n=1 Tax=Siccirubricoccus phaeus TaxID=2595053 RepID=UPI001F27295A|nr:XrtA/PEP-CTERM system exopolysaccharide export protein [Siccirubricoccus phaeus]
MTFDSVEPGGAQPGVAARRAAARRRLLPPGPAGLAMLALLLGLGACAAPPAGGPGAAGAAQAGTGQSGTTATPAPDYVIGPGDNLSIFVYRSPELSAELPVRPDGRLSLPLVPDIEAAGRTPSQLAKVIEEKLKEYVREPNVTVMVRSFIGPTSRQIRIIGEAAQPKAIPYREGMSVLDVLIEVGGLTRYAAGNRAEIVRRGPDGQAQNIRLRLSDLLRDGDISQDMPMRPGDTLVIPQSWF